jgi:hypothetical protein
MIKNDSLKQLIIAIYLAIISPSGLAVTVLNVYYMADFYQKKEKTMGRKKSSYSTIKENDERILWIISKLERMTDTALDILCRFIRGLAGE